ncbi:hypothetical protein PHET_00533 [Paragonimus heterotremus]|uniref:Uncharacterized protein n=1 Tax=Paragonimus heterotremus TaxID=100268 RepID=A0A8J4T4R9_9TREM|nr:hypothetical protein PHET_00533 [Paragonimus heterotremus]
MAMEGSEAIAISAVVNDAVTELRIVENLVASSIKSAGQKGDKYFEEANFTHMNKILSKFSCYMTILHCTGNTNYKTTIMLLRESVGLIKDSKQR